MDKKTVVLGVIGSDCHAVGNKILDYSLSAAGFNVVGENNAHYTIAISESVVLKNPTNDEMTLNAFTNNATKVLSAAGTESFKVGGTLNVAAGQASGLYSSTYVVTVTYE